jgi:hypothetical protein
MNDEHGSSLTKDDKERRDKEKRRKEQTEKNEDFERDKERRSKDKDRERNPTASTASTRAPHTLRIVHSLHSGVLPFFRVVSISHCNVGQNFHVA